MKEQGEYEIMPPKQGRCPVCGAEHAQFQPHNADSLYYRMIFRGQHGRFPTWEDAMAHCPENVKEACRELLRQQGIDTGAEEHG